MRSWSRIAVALLLGSAGPAAADDCPPPSGSVRVMLHEDDVLAGRLAVYRKAAQSPLERVVALRQLFSAAGCKQVTEIGNGEDRSVECSVPGTGPSTIVVGVGQTYDGSSSPPLLASLQEALAVAPRHHTFRWIAFSTHQTKEERTKLVQKPKGAMRVVDALSADQRERVDVMVHLGPIGFGPVWTHPPGGDDRLRCAFEAAAKAAGVERGVSDRLDRRCQNRPVSLECEESGNWAGGNDWLPFRRAGIPVFGIHTGKQKRVGARLDAVSYVATYRLLAIFFALADEALAPAAPPPQP